MINLQPLSDAIKRRLDPTTRTFIRVGYLTSDMERTRNGVHMLLNFLEDQYGKQFASYLKEREAEAEKEAQKSGG